MTFQRVSEKARHKKTLKRRAECAVDAENRLKNLRSVENTVAGASQVVTNDELFLTSQSLAAKDYSDSEYPDEFASAGASAVLNTTINEREGEEPIEFTNNELRQLEPSTFGTSDSNDEYKSCDNNASDDGDESVNSDPDDEDLPQLNQSVYLPLLCTSFYLKNGLTKAALSTHLKILSISTHHSYKKLASPYTLLSKYNSLKSEFQIQYVCREKKCKALLQCGDNGYPKVDQICGHKHINNSSNCCFVLHLPIEQQLRYFLEHHGLPEVIPEVDPNIRSDVNSGQLYRDLVQAGLIDCRTITLQINADGASCYKKSKYSFWPLMALINDVSYKLRRSYVILLALWFGNKKPPLNVFIDHSIQELKRLEKDGLQFKGIVYKIKLLIVTTDTVARPVLLNTTQFNGKFGCNFCLHPGERISKGTKGGGARVYPEPDPDDENPFTFPLRSIEQHLNDLKFGTPRNPVNGIFGPTPLANLPNFDFVKAFVPEYMHSVCQGVFKLFTGLFTSTKEGNSKKPFFLGTKMKIINAKLSQIKVPYEITRIIDSFNDFSDWKSSMFRNFFLYLFPVLEDVMPPVYFRHLCSLSYGMYVLLQDRVSLDDVVKVGILFKYLVVDFEKLYGKENVTINIHFLTHLSKSVLDWGCLWSTSTFLPESFNGDLLKLFNGTQHVIQQMAGNYLLKSAVRDEVLQLVKSHQIPSPVYSLFADLLNLPRPRELSKGIVVNGEKIKLIGKADNRRKITIEEEVSIRNFLMSNRDYRLLIKNEDDFENCIISYGRFQVLDSMSVFTTAKYTRSKRRMNHFAFMKDSTFCLIESIWFLKTDLISRAFLVGRKIGNISIETYLPAPIHETIFSVIPGQTTKLIGLSPEFVVYDPIQIKSKCVASMYNLLTETFILTALSNNKETD